MSREKRQLRQELRELKRARKDAWWTYLKELRKGLLSLAKTTEETIYEIDRQVDIREARLQSLNEERLKP